MISSNPHNLINSSQEFPKGMVCQNHTMFVPVPQLLINYSTLSQSKMPEVEIFSNFPGTPFNFHL